MPSFRLIWFCRLCIIVVIVLQYTLVVKPFFDFGIDSYPIEEIRSGAVSSRPYSGTTSFIFAFFMVMFEPFMSMSFALTLFVQVIVFRSNKVMKKENILSVLILIAYVGYLYFYFSPTGLASQWWISD